MNDRTAASSSRISRSRLLSGLFATGALTACSGASRTAAPVSTATILQGCAPLNVAAPLAGDPYGINEILGHDAFKQIDKGQVIALLDTAPQQKGHHAAYCMQTSQQPQTSFVITSLPSVGIVIQTPGTYTFAGDLSWTPVSGAQSSAITIASNDVTLDFAGHRLTATVPDSSQSTAGVAVCSVSNVTIKNGTIANVSDNGLCARLVDGLTVSGLTVAGITVRNLTMRDLTPAGIYAEVCSNVSITGCTVTQMAVTTDASAGIQLILTSNATISDCLVDSVTNFDGSVQGYSYLGCTAVATTRCTASNFQSHFNGNVSTPGHTTIGFVPILSQQLTFTDCASSNLTGCCDDAHGMSVFVASQVTVTRFRADTIVDGMSPSRSGAKATGLEVYGANVTLVDCVATNIHAINPQDKQAAGFSAWGVSIAFQGCSASNVSVEASQPVAKDAIGIGFGWAPDPRCAFCYVGALFTTYTNCSAANCDVGFDSWYHVDSTWTGSTTTNCKTPFLAQPGGTRTVSGDGCSECNPPAIVTLTNIASGNTYS